MSESQNVISRLDIVIHDSILTSNNKVNNLSPNWGIMLTMQENLNLRIGTQIWKKYINATFWNYISTPINFTITLFSALSAGQTGSGSSYLNDNQLFYILFITFVLSITNTFFNLKEKAKLNYESAKIYETFGSDFEKIYFIPVLCDEDVIIKLKYYRELQEKIDNQSSKETIEYANYITEIIFILTKYCCCANFNFNKLRRNERFWLLDGIKNKKIYQYGKNEYSVDMSFFEEDFTYKENNNNIETNIELINKITDLSEKIKELEKRECYNKFINSFINNKDLSLVNDDKLSNFKNIQFKISKNTQNQNENYDENHDENYDENHDENYDENYDKNYDKNKSENQDENNNITQFDSNV
jgi:hypothetical protein